jgi:hypothetical protein
MLISFLALLGPNWRNWDLGWEVGNGQGGKKANGKGCGDSGNKRRKMGCREKWRRKVGRDAELVGGCVVCWDWEKNWKNLRRIVGKVAGRDRKEVWRKMGRDIVGSEGRNV